MVSLEIAALLFDFQSFIWICIPVQSAEFGHLAFEKRHYLISLLYFQYFISNFANHKKYYLRTKGGSSNLQCKI